MLSERDLAITRYATAKFVLGVLRALNAARFGDDTNLGANLPEIIMGIAIYVGQHEGRPFTTAKLAGFLGMKRPTVHRRVQELVRAEVVDVGREGIRFRETWLGDPVTHETARQFQALFRDALADLSTLDTKVVDPHAAA
jgi:hypothetical protein